MIKYYNSLSWRLGTQLKTREPDGDSSSFSFVSSRWGTWCLAMFLALLFAVPSTAQVATTYTFSQSSGSYSEISGGTLVQAQTSNSGATSLDDNTYTLAAGTIPFTFVYDGLPYTGFQLNTNGWISFGALITNSYTPLSSTIANAGYISALSRDLQGGSGFTANRTSGSALLTGVSSAASLQVGDALYGTGIAVGATITAISGTDITMSANATTTGVNGVVVAGNGSIRYETIGSAPNRVFVVQWKNFKPFGTTATTMNGVRLNFQIRLYEGSNNIETVYGTTSNGVATLDLAAEVGLRGPNNTFATNVNNRLVDATNNWSTSLVGTLNSSKCRFTSTAPATAPVSGLTYRWTAPAPPSCGSTSLNATTAILSTSATLNWNAAFPLPSAGYEWEVRTSGAAGSGATGLANNGSVGAGVTSANATGLTPVTPYTVFVRANCGAGVFGPWSSAGSFTTACLPISTFPWTESFEGATIGSTVVGTSTNLPACWNSQNIRWSSSNATTYNTPRTGVNYLRYAWATTNAFIWTPGFELTAGVSYDFSFYGQGDGFTGWNNDIYVNTAATEAGATQLTPTYTAAGSGTIALQSYVKVTRTFVPSANGVYYFAIRGNQASGTPWYMAFDDFSLEITPQCVQPAGLSVVFSSASSANLSWSAPSPAPAVGYEWAFTTSATPPASGTATGSLTATIGSLSPATTYYLHVRSVCEDGVEYSAWSTSSGFVPPLITAVPWTEGFATTTLPAQWTASSFFLSSTSNVGANPGNALAINLWSSTPSGNFTTPNLGPVTANQLFSFDYRIINFSGTDIPGAGTSTYVLAVSTDFGATYSTLDTFSNDGVAGWRNKTYSLAAYAGQNVKFRLTGTWISGDYYLGLDNFAVTALCEGIPTGGTVSIATQSVCQTFPVAPISVTGASIDSGITYQWEESTNGGTSWANATGGTGATTTTYQPPVYAGTVILYRLKVTCTASSEENYSTISEINGNPTAVPFTESFSDVNTLVGWSTSGFSVGAVRGATGNPGNNALANLWVSATTAQLTTANYGPIVAGQAIMFDYQVSNFGIPYDVPAADSGSFEVFVSADCGVTYTSLGVTTNDGVAGYRSKVLSLDAFVGQNVIVRILGTWVSGDYDLSIDNLSIMVPPPSITSFGPLGVCEDSESIVTITGEFFDGVTNVAVGSSNATFNFVDSNTITFTLPLGASTNFITVTTPGGTATSSIELTVNPYPEEFTITGDSALCMPNTLELLPSITGGTFSSSNEAVATVVGFTVTGVSEGTATIIYSVTVEGCTTVATHDVTVNAPVVISSFTPSQTVVTGNDATFSVAATGTGLTYQWFAFDGIDTYELDDLDSLFGESYTGSTSSSLVVGSIPADLNGFEFYCEVSGASPCTPETTTPNSILNVGDTGIGTDPASVSLCDGGSTTFTVVRSGDDLEEDITYAWEYDADGTDNWQPVADGDLDGMTISDAETSVLSVSTITLVHNGYRFRAVVTGPANAATSNPALLSVNQSVAIGTHPQNSNVCNSGGTTNYNVDVTGGTPSSISWVYSTSATGPFNPIANNTPIGATYNTAVLGTLGVTTTGSTPVNTYYYRAIVNATSPCSNVESDVASLTIDNPTISSQPANAGVLRGSSTSFTVATPTMGATIQWQRATAVGGPYFPVANETPTGVTYSGADTATLTVITSAASATGATNYYRAVVSSPVTCSVNSTGALLTIFDYCTIPTSTSTASFFDSFATTGGLTNITNSASGFSTGGYGNFTTVQSASQYQNSSVSFSSTLVGTTVGVAIWVDWNQDGIFQTSERVYNTAAFVSVASGSFNVPATALLGATRMRIAMDFNATSPLACPATGGRREIEDYTFVVLQQPACAGTPTPASVVASVANVCFSGTSTLTASGFSTVETGLTRQWFNSSGAIAGATAATYTTPVLTAPETYFFRVTCTNSGLPADSNSVTIGVNEPALISTEDGTRCGTGTVDLSAEGSEGTSLNWFTAPSGGQPIFTGPIFTTPTLSSTTTYYVAAGLGNTIESGAKASSSGASGSFVGANSGIVFNVTSPVTINSTVIYPTGTGTVTIALYNSAGTELLSTAAIPVSGSGISTPVTVPLNFSVQPGTGYRLLLKAFTGITGLIRDSSGNIYPFNSPNTSVTGGWISGASTTYYFFYNLQISTGCSSGRTAVVATVTPPPALTLSGTSTEICNGETSAAVTVTSTVEDYDSYIWSPSTGVSGDVISGFTFNPTITTAYTLTATNSVSDCANTVMYNVTVNALPLPYTILPANPAVCSVDGTAVLLSTSLPTPGSTTVSFGTNLESEGTNPAVYSASISGIPAGATITSAQLQFTNVNAINGSWRSEIRVALTGAHTLAPTQISTLGSGGLITPDPSVSLPGFTATGGAINLVLTETFNDGAVGEFVIDATFGSAQLVINYTAPSVSTTWAPTAGLFTDAAATIPYTGNNAATVYAKPTEETTYTSTVVTAIGNCPRTATVTVGITPATTWYADADGDTFGNDAITLQACNQPAGYVAVGGDCNDAVATIFPGATEICFDGILQNCNGELNDGCPAVLTQIRPYFCGTTLQNVNSSILADVPTGLPSGAAVTGYRYEITNLSTNDVREVEKTIAMIRITDSDIAGFGTAYSIRVAVRINQEWQDYGTGCSLFTPAIPTTTVSTLCGQILPSLQSTIFATPVTSALGYEFEVSRIEGGIAVQTSTIERSINNFKITLLSGIAYVYSTEYQVRVRVKAEVNGVEAWSGYGAVCSVFTPAAPEAAIEGCGGEAGITPAALSTPIYATPITGATLYRFTLTDDNGYSQVYTTPSRFFRLSNFNALSPLTPGGNYSVTVETEIYGNFYAGKDCNILVPGGMLIRPVEVVKAVEPIKGVPTEFNAIAYPNPFATSFAIDVRTSNTEKVSLTLYDMAGRLLEVKELNASEVANYQFGDRFPSGVYNMIVTQGEETKTVRVVKQ